MILEKYRKTVGVQNWKQNDDVRQNAMAKPSGVVMYPNKNHYKQPETAIKVYQA